MGKVRLTKAQQTKTLRSRYMVHGPASSPTVYAETLSEAKRLGSIIVGLLAFSGRYNISVSTVNIYRSDGKPPRGMLPWSWSFTGWFTWIPLRGTRQPMSKILDYGRKRYGVEFGVWTKQKYK